MMDSTNGEMIPKRVIDAGEALDRMANADEYVLFTKTGQANGKSKFSMVHSSSEWRDVVCEALKEHIEESESTTPQDEKMNSFDKIEKAFYITLICLVGVLTCIFAHYTNHR